MIGFRVLVSSICHILSYFLIVDVRHKLNTLLDFPLSDLDILEFLINPIPGPCCYNLLFLVSMDRVEEGHRIAFSKKKL